jgi:chromosomal replication initiator protein
MQNNVNAVWKIASSQIKLKINENNFKIWFNKIKLESIDNNIATISCQNSFTSDYIQKNYLNITKNSIKEVYGRDIDIVFKVRPETVNTQEEPIFSIQEDKKMLLSSNLNPKYQIKNFIVGSSNRLAHAAALAIIESPGTLYNPFFIYGGVGLGKTHLMQAIGNEILSKNPDTKITYMSSETLLNDFINSIVKGKNENFRKKYRENDVLIIDDIQFISGKKGIQEEFFHTFNTLQQSNKQIILASDRHPKEIENLEERLVSRFEGGMVADITNPDEEMRIAILRKKCEEKNINIDEDIINLISENVKSNIRELEGVLTKIVATENILNKKLNKDEVSKLIGIHIKKRNRVLKPKDIIITVCEKFGISQREIIGTKRTNRIVLPRQIAMYMLRKDLNLPLMEVANILKRKDHTTVLHAVDKIEKLIENDMYLKEEISDLRGSLETN